MLSMHIISHHKIIVTFIVLGTKTLSIKLEQLNPVTDVSVVFTIINNVLNAPFTRLPTKPGIVDGIISTKNNSNTNK